MTPILGALLVILVGARLRIRPQPRLLAMPPVAAGTPSEQRRAGLVFHRSARRQQHPGPHEAATWCDDLSRAVGSGSTLTAAIRAVEPPRSCAGSVDSIRLALERGAALHDACQCATSSPDLQVVLMVVRACAVHGGSAAEPLSRTAATLRSRAAEAAERRTQSAQARMSAIVMTILPICMLALLLVTSGPVRRFITSPAGLVIVAAGAVLNMLGWRWMGRLIAGGRT
jgi:Flp pilus assembly protein TadB